MHSTNSSSPPCKEASNSKSNSYKDDHDHDDDTCRSSSAQIKVLTVLAEGNNINLSCTVYQSLQHRHNLNTVQFDIV